jgi:predicted GIY-YIG superfamily endonuclease
MKNFENCVIYKIYSIDNQVTEFYIGSTIDLRKRLYVHKHHCKTKNIKLYNYINEHGGWSNFKHEILETFSCESSLQKLDKERSYIKDLNPTLNMNLPFCNNQDMKEYKRNYMKKYLKDPKNEHHKEYYRNYMKLFMRKVYEKRKEKLQNQEKTINSNLLKEKIKLLNNGILHFD